MSSRPTLRLTSWPCRGLGALLLAVSLAPLQAEPYRPASDDEVLVRLPTRRADPASRALAALRQAQQAAPRDAERAVAVARLAVAQAQALGDPRYVGQAQAALGPWWAEPTPPADVQTMRGVIALLGQRLDAARADLQAVVAREPGHAEAWAWLAELHRLRGDPEAARQACRAMAGGMPTLRGAGCLAQADALTGGADAAAMGLRAAIEAAPDAPAPLRLWGLARLGEIEALRGDTSAAETAFESALALGLDDVALRAAHADLLLAQGRAGDVLVQLRNGADADALLLRLALAAQAATSPLAARYADELAARFDAARRRGDTSHRAEEARFELSVRQRPAAALALARAQFEVQRTPADARLLLEAALAARVPDAAAPAQAWMRATGLRSPDLQALAARVEAMR